MEHYDLYEGEQFIERCWYLGYAQRVLKDRPYLTVRRIS